MINPYKKLLSPRCLYKQLSACLKLSLGIQNYIQQNFFISMNRFAVLFSCFCSLLLVVAAAAQARNNGVYIVYTGAAISSATGFDDSNHILSSSSMEMWKDRVIHRYSNGFSGFAARLSEEEAESIAQRPEVVSVFPDPVIPLHTTRSWDFLKELSGVGSKPNPVSSSSLSGQDVIIGVIDTGIWPEAKSFSDKGLGPIPKKWKGKCIQGPDFKASMCNRKLIGARNYITQDKSTSARDHDGHGTHVAAIAAGAPVLNASYNGIARGTARGGSPGSRIAVYRACNSRGCEGSAVLKAFEDAIADGVDIISVSLGISSSNGNYLLEPVSLGALHAVENGILVVASAGDHIPMPDFSSISNTAPWILTVGASSIDRFFESDIVLGGTNRVIKAHGIHSAGFKKSPVYPLTASGSSAARNCMPGSLDAKNVKGKIVVCETTLDDGTGDGEAGRLEVLKLGGIGMIAIEAHGRGVVKSVSGSSPMVDINSRNGVRIQAYANSTRNPMATILPTVAVKFKPAPTVAFFSGLGDVNSPSPLKPDVVAPGVDILSAWPSNVTNEAFNILSGTSMACPHVSGIAALIKSKYPTWSPSAIKSAIMTTTTQINNKNEPITRFSGEVATAWECGSGAVTSLGPLNPGLVYETEPADYLRFLCNDGYNASTIKLISSKLPARFSCPKNSDRELMVDMNYPSISISGFTESRIRRVVRTVTNVGEEESVYDVSVESSNEHIKLQVSPSKLQFSKKIKKLSYQVTFTLFNASVYPNGYEYGSGSITWSSEKYRVRIPFGIGYRATNL